MHTQHRHQPRRPFPTPALNAWRAELRRGQRARTTFDALFRAACCEQWALDYSDIPALAEAFRADARAIVRDALKAQRREQGAA